ncbi:MAG: hypothetical protein IT430_10645 [Phycisphaerales bacterium]|nr:hypothetical protein [Phycisphaerales bacterium]
MEFVQYREVLPGLQEHGLIEATDEAGLTRLEIEPQPRLKTLHVRDAASKVQPYPDAVVVEHPKAELAEFLEQALDRIHLSEVLVIPVGQWRAVIDCVAFDLAADEEWREIDALAALNQNTRNALAVTRGETRLLIDMVRSLFNNGSEPSQDIAITSDVAPLLVEVFHDGAISLTWDGAIIDALLKHLRE